MRHGVFFQKLARAEILAAKRAKMRLLAAVHTLMRTQLALDGENSIARLANVLWPTNKRDIEQK